VKNNQSQETGNSTEASKLFSLLSICRFRFSQRTHAHVYSVDAERSRPYRLPTSSNENKKAKKKNKTRDPTAVIDKTFAEVKNATPKPDGIEVGGVRKNEAITDAQYKKQIRSV